jgi:pimeloyl-ACP methyl ester carboxylesterase
MIRRGLLWLGLGVGLARGAMGKHEYAEVNGVRLHYVAAGEGKLILFLHGFPEFWYEWKKQLLEFSRDHRAVAPDMRGYNLSAKPEALEQYQMPVLIEDVRALVKHLGRQKCILVAHDWGGAVAWVFAAAHPEMVEKLVIINAPHPGVFRRELRENPAQQKASHYMLMFRSAGAEQALAADNYAQLVKIVLGGHHTAEDHQAYLEAWSQPGALTGGLNYYRANRVGPPAQEGEPVASLAPNLPLKIQAPTLVIWGEKDTALLTGNLNGLEEYVPRLTVKRIPDGSHWVIHEKPDLINRHIRDFLR